MKTSNRVTRNDVGDRAGPIDVRFRSSKRTAPVNYAVKIVHFRVVRQADDADPRIIDTPSAANELARELIPDDAKEHFLILMLNTKNRVVAVREVSIGTLSASLVHPREVFGPALRILGVAAIILIHNHPSGDPTPSPEDLRSTRQLVEGAVLLNVKIHDHIVVASGNPGFVSMHESGLM